jgi:type I site-specific deoxyribonuclease
MAVPKLRFKEFNQEWKNIVLEEVAQVERGKFSARPRNDPKYFNGNIPFVQTGDISNSDIFIEKYSQTLNELGLTVSKLFPPNTILITIAANIGDSAITKFSIACPDSIVGILVRENLSNVYFLKNILDLKKKTLDSQATQNAQKNINLQVLKPLEISIPTIDEQRKIANFLTAVDEKISQLNEQHQLMIQYKKGVMQKIFNQEIRFKDDNGEEFGEWEERTLGDISNPQQWKTISSSDMTESGYPVFGANGYIGFYSEYNHENETITVTCRGATCGEVTLVKPKTYITGNSMSIDDIDEQKYNVKFIYYALCIRGFSDVITGSAQPQIVGSSIKKVKFFVPCIKEQSEIANFLTWVDQRIENLAQQLEQVKTWKKGLLQQMFV